MGHEVRVMDSSITFDSISDIRQNIGEQTMTEEKQTQDTDELIREIIAIASRNVYAPNILNG